MPYASCPAVPPKFFIDRDLGAIAFPQKLQEAGLDVVTSQEYYGIQVSQEVPDEIWIKLTANKGWVSISDDKFTQKELERETIKKTGARCFVIEDGTITAEEAANLVIDNLGDIITICQELGPFLCILLTNGGIKRII